MRRIIIVGKKDEAPHDATCAWSLAMTIGSPDSAGVGEEEGGTARALNKF